ncbi:hypothetical protein DFH28DRAFT_898484 [Melampsora americana]|nr:hypothetical protein DFH28DRAFT_898484 [Melampsora americana]
MNVSNAKPRLRAPTPSALKESSKRRRVSYNPSFSVEAKNTIPQDPLGLKSIVEQFPTHEQQEQTESQAAQTQENITKTITEAMSNIIKRIVIEENKTKERIALGEMNVKVRLARSQLVIELIHSKMDPAATEEFALCQLPDILPS